MRFLLPLIALPLLVVAFLHSQILSSKASEHNTPSSPASPQLKIASKLHPRMVELLKKQADERKEFYDDQSKDKNELKTKQNEEMQELLEKHRAARAEFSKEKHTADERATFYKGQRDEMAELKTKQKNDQRELSAKHKEKLREFHHDQKEKRDELEEDLRKSK